MKRIVSLCTVFLLLLTLVVYPAQRIRANGIGTLYATSAKGTVIEYAPVVGEVVEEIKEVGSGQLAFDYEGGRIYIANPATDSVIIFSVDSLAVQSKIAIEGGPTTIATARAKRDFFFVGTKGGAVMAVDGAKLETVGKVVLGGAVVALALEPSGKQLAVLLEDRNLIILATPSLDIVQRIRLNFTPRALAVNENISGSMREGLVREIRYWVSGNEGILVGFDGKGVERTRITLEGALPALAATSSGERILVATEKGLVYFVDPVAGRLAGHLFLGGPITALATDPDGQRAYAALPSLNQLVTFSLDPINILNVLKSKDAPEQISATPLKLPGNTVGRYTLPHTGVKP